MNRKSVSAKGFFIGGERVEKGERKKIMLSVAKLFDHTSVTIPVEVIRGSEEGPVLFISAAIHGDEINGVEIIRRLRKKKALSQIKGTLILVPIVNVYGFNMKSRYLPDRRDLNRSFPGNKSGSLAGQIASLFMKEIVAKCTHGIDLHTGAIHRYNLPQIRAFLDDEATKDLAKGFGVPVVINSSLRDGSLREAARKKGVSMLLFEGGEALRFDPSVIRAGLNGCLSVMRRIGMIPSPARKTIGQEAAPRETKVFVAMSSHWMRAPHSGILGVRKHTGESVTKGEVIGLISDPFGDNSIKVIAEEDGIIIGVTMFPLVNRGDAIFHVAEFRNSGRVKREIDRYDDLLN